MSGFEIILIADVRRPTTREVMKRVTAEQACRGQPLSSECLLGRDQVVQYLIQENVRATELATVETCRHCDVFKNVLNCMFDEWEDWTLRQQFVHN